VTSKELDLNSILINILQIPILYIQNVLLVYKFNLFVVFGLVCTNSFQFDCETNCRQAYVNHAQIRFLKPTSTEQLE